MPNKPTYPGVYVEETPSDDRTITGVATSITAFIGSALCGPVDEPVVINSFSDFERQFGGLRVDSMMSYAVRDFYQNGGSQAIIVRVTAIEGGPDNDITDAELTGDENNKTGLYALAKADLFNLLCLPPPKRGANTAPSVYQSAMAYCEKRRAMLIVDPPAEWGASPAAAVGNAIAGLGTLNLSGVAARNAALYFPRIIQADPQCNNEPDVFVPSGIIAGIMARTDRERGVWKAPAGLQADLRGIMGLQVKLNDEENNQLNQLGINCLRSFPVNRHLVWGARTLRGADHLADEYKYVPIRRLALFLEESIYRGTKWAVFEPNDEPLWAQIRLHVGEFMYDLFRQGAFQGTTPKDAYLVKCDRETTTQDDIDSGIFNIHVGFAPLKPAEFVVIKIQQLAAQINY